MLDPPSNVIHLKVGGDRNHVQSQSGIIWNFEQLIRDGLHHIDVFGCSRHQQGAGASIRNHQGLTPRPFGRREPNGASLQQPLDGVGGARQPGATNRDHLENGLIEITLHVKLQHKVLHNLKPGLRGGHQHTVGAKIGQHDRGLSHGTSTRTHALPHL